MRFATCTPHLWIETCPVCSTLNLAASNLSFPGVREIQNPVDCSLLPLPLLVVAAPRPPARVGRGGVLAGAVPSRAALRMIETQT